MSELVIKGGNLIIDKGDMWFDNAIEFDCPESVDEMWISIISGIDETIIHINQEDAIAIINHLKKQFSRLAPA